MVEAELENFTDTKPRRWLNEITGPDGLLVDTTRRIHPERRGMFTCKSTERHNIALRTTC
jgi:AP endonuclease-2